MDKQLREAALEYHRHPRPGKISVTPTKVLSNQRDLSLAYSPGVAAACLEIAEHPHEAATLTGRANLLAVITNGTAVLGLGNIGPLASKPVMEGKAVLFKKFAGIDVFDLEVDALDPDRFIEVVAALEPTFGGINLEDIKAPECFYIEEQLRSRMKIPVFHDDQHGTAIVVAAAIMNGLHLVGKQFSEVKVVTSGAGAAALACLSLLEKLGVRRENIWVTDIEGVVYEGRTTLMDPLKQRYAQKTDARKLGDVIGDCDVFMGLSAGGVLKPEMVARMADKPLILALANPEPEISPAEVSAVRNDAIMATGRSDYPNQVNNVLCFPFIFRGALDVGATAITDEMKLAAVKALAELARAEQSDIVASAYAETAGGFGPEYIIPRPFDPRLLVMIAPAVARAAMESGVATRPITDWDAYHGQLNNVVWHSGLLMKPVFAEARKDPSRIIFAEGESERVLRAAQTVIDEGLAWPILVGRPAVIMQRIERYGLRMRPGTDFELVNQDDDPRFKELWMDYHRLMERRGVSVEYAKKEVHHPDRLADAQARLRRWPDLRHLRHVPGAPRLRRDGAGPQARRQSLLRAQRAGPDRPHAVPRRHLCEPGSQRRTGRGDDAARRSRGAAFRHRAQGCLAVAFFLR
jgi:malate dehydrogenase (oxaloacetate-decarboxylating)(NADP+)